MNKLVVGKIYKKIYRWVLAVLSMTSSFCVNAKAISPENEEEVKEILSRILASDEFGE